MSSKSHLNSELCCLVELRLLPSPDMKGLKNVAKLLLLGPSELHLLTGTATTGQLFVHLALLGILVTLKITHKQSRKSH